jgi:hypothetical protein
MKTLKEIEREIYLIKGIIRVLKVCLWISFKELQIRQFISTCQDLKIVTRELDKLIAAKKEILGAIKEPENVSQNRSRKTFF